MLSYFAFWYDLVNFRNRFSLPPCLDLNCLNFSRVCDHNKFAMLCNDSVLLIYDILKNKIPWKSWLDPRFFRNSKSKWTLKWLPLNMGYFKFYFRKGKSNTNNFVSYVSLDFWICHVVSSRVGIAMHFIPAKCLVFWYLLIDSLSKKRWHGNFGSILCFLVTPSKSEI